MVSLLHHQRTVLQTCIQYVHTYKVSVNVWPHKCKSIHYDFSIHVIHGW
uniref:Uncharacterized protein n=1 Tax=Anguilla anguilla TaxID=7936 RepID=A0A0E9X084_ANGAN